MVVGMKRFSQRVPKYGLHKRSGQAVVCLGGKDVYLGKYGTEESRRLYDEKVRAFLAKRNSVPRTTPAYRHHRADGRAVVTLGDRDFFLGQYGTAESREAYDRLIAAWIGNGRRVQGLDHALNEGVPDDFTVIELIARYLEHARELYPDSNEVSIIKYALRPVRRLFGHLPAAQFSPKKLKLVQKEMIALKWRRKNINKMIGRVRKAFKWAESEELVPKGTWQNLKTVEGLRRGRGGVEEGEPVRPVPTEDRLALRGHVPRQVWDLTQLQYLSGARAGELVVLRAVDIDTSGAVWRYRPERHKNAHRDQPRVILFGPKAQEILRRYMGGRAVTAYLFSPAEAEAEWRAAKRATRKTKVQPSQVRRAEAAAQRTRRRAPGERYTVASYRRAIERGCRKADIGVWPPHRLRHSAATDIKNEFGLEYACAVLGHKNMDTTLIYAELELRKAEEVAARVG
jgi:integrase